MRRFILAREPVWRPEAGVLLLSVFLQLALALAFGHSHDMHIFMGTGYLVGSGQSPYAAQDLSSVFHDASFQENTTVGYAPPWPLVLGLVYRFTYAVFPDLPLYNLAIKVPLVAANIGLAYLVAWTLKKLQVPPSVSRRAWVMLMLNPLLLYFGSAWGQFDSIVALLALGSLILLHGGKWMGASVALALAIAFKPTAVPLLPVSLVYLLSISSWEAVRYASSLLLSLLLFTVTPFLLLGWAPDPILQNWNAHFTVGGGLSPMSLLELLRDSYRLPGKWWLLGLAWVPALGVGTLALRRAGRGLTDLLRSSTALVLIFFLTRTWLSEPNVILVLPLALLLTSLGELDARMLVAVCVLPLAFTLFNDSPLQLLFPAFPQATRTFDTLSAGLRPFRLLARTAVVLPWQLAGWWMVCVCLRRRLSPRDRSDGPLSLAEDRPDDLAAGAGRMAPEAARMATTRDPAGNPR